MKLAALFCFLGCGLASAVTIQPDVHLTFDTVGANQDTDTRKAAVLKNTGNSTSYTIDKIGSAAYMRAGDLGYDYISTTGNSYKNVSGGEITGIAISNNSTLTLANSFTLTFAAKFAAASSNVNLQMAGLMVGDATVSIEHFLQGDDASKKTLGLTGTALQSGGASTTIAPLTETKFARLTLVYTAGTTTSEYGTFTLYNDQVKLGDWTSNLLSQSTNVVTLQLGKVGNSATLHTVIFDEVGVYATALTADEIKSLVGKASGNITRTDAVPEPATATLSLLALAGLAARRRRR